MHVRYDLDGAVGASCAPFLEIWPHIIVQLKLPFLSLFVAVVAGNGCSHGRGRGKEKEKAAHGTLHDSLSASIAIAVDMKNRGTVFSSGGGWSCMRKRK